MTLTERRGELVRACFPGLWINSFEHEDALTEIAGMCREQDWQLAVWDVENGLHTGDGNAGSEPPAADPLAALRSLDALASPEGAGLLVLVNFHRFLNNAEIVQAVARQIQRGKQQRTFVLILAPVVQLPVELEKLFVVIDHELPDRRQLQQIAEGVATEDGELPDGQELDAVLDAAAGLTRFEAEGAFSLSLVRHGKVTPAAVWSVKSGALKKQGLLEFHDGRESFEQIGGLENLKAFCLRALARSSRATGDCRPRGVLLLSPPGCGKSQFAKALGHETGRPTLLLDMGRLLAGLVGQSEENLRHALALADAMAPCVLFCDELEKALSGAASSGQSDSGVTARLFGRLLSWLNDHTSDVFFVGTCNDISKLPPEFARAERFDGVFFIDLPESKQRQSIWDIYLAKFELDADQKRPDDDQWTGAEIRACCRLARLLDVPLVQAAQNIVPVSRTAGEAVDTLRQWATGRCLAADRPGIYAGGAHARRQRRRVSRDPSLN